MDIISDDGWVDGWMNMRVGWVGGWMDGSISHQLDGSNFALVHEYCVFHYIIFITSSIIE